jgi:hypothetical protein
MMTQFKLVSKHGSFFGSQTSKVPAPKWKFRIPHDSSSYFGNKTNYLQEDKK